MSIRVSFGSADFKNPSLVYQDKSVSNQKHSNSKTKNSSCCCHFTPTHIENIIQNASDEALKEHMEIVTEYKLSKLKVSSVSADKPHEHHSLGHLSLFGWHWKKQADPSSSDDKTDDKSETLQLLYDAKNKTDVPGKLVKTPKGNKDHTARRAFEAAKATYQFYHDVLNRDSIDGKDMKIISTVHYDNKYNNAMWNESQMIYGDGDGIIFGDFTKDFDVPAHELTHGITQYTANLKYKKQSGALNESVSDVFASCIKQWHLQQTWDKADWLIGDEVLLGPGALRSLKAPGSAYNTKLMGKDPQPGTMDAYNNSSEDNGGVHINSGIPNRAFYIVCKGIGGHSYDKPIKIWYETLTSNKLTRSATFTDFANLTIEKAGELYGKNSAEQKSVIYAWYDVKVTTNVS